MDHLKEQLKKHYDKTELPAGLHQKLLTLEAPEPASVPVRMSRKRLLTPIAAMLIAAVALLGGGEYLISSMPDHTPTPDALPSYMETTDDTQGAPMDYAPEPTSTPDSECTAPAKPSPKSMAPETQPAAVVTPQQPPANTEPAPDALPEPLPPLTNSDPEPGSLPDSQPPSEDIPPTSLPGTVDPPVDDPVDPPDDPVVPPIDIPDIPFPPGYNPDGAHAEAAGSAGAQKPPASAISGRYVYEDGQHMVYLTNCDTGETCTLDLTSNVTIAGYHGIHNLFGCLIYVSLYSPPSLESVGPSSSISPNCFEFKVEILDKA